jgi:hypothetical protein
MNCYGVQDLLLKLDIKKLTFKTYYNKLELNKDILVDSSESFYYCKDKEDYEKSCQDYSWHLVKMYYFYDSDTDAVVFEYTVEDTDIDSYDTQDRLFAIVPVQFLQAYKIELEFRKENINESYNCN